MRCFPPRLLLYPVCKYFFWSQVKVEFLVDFFGIIKCLLKHHSSNFLICPFSICRSIIIFFWGRSCWNNCIVIWKLIPLLYSLLIQLTGSSRCTEGFSLYFFFFCNCSQLITLNVASVLSLRLHFVIHVFFYSFPAFFLTRLSNCETPNACTACCCLYGCCM